MLFVKFSLNLLRYTFVCLFVVIIIYLYIYICNYVSMYLYVCVCGNTYVCVYIVVCTYILMIIKMYNLINQDLLMFIHFNSFHFIVLVFFSVCYLDFSVVCFQFGFDIITILPLPHLHLALYYGLELSKKCSPCNRQTQYSYFVIRLS